LDFLTLSHSSFFTLIFRLGTHRCRHRKRKQVWIISNEPCGLVWNLLTHASIFTSRHCIIRIIFLFATQIRTSAWSTKWKCYFRRSRRYDRFFPIRINLILTRTFHKRTGKYWIILSWIQLFRSLVNLLIILNISINIKVSVFIRNLWILFGLYVHSTVHLSMFLF